MRSAMTRILAALVFLVPLVSAASVTVTINGTNHTIPQTNEKGWGNNVTAWIQAVSQYTLQPSGGAFTLTADTDFGANYGLKSLYLKSRATNVSSTGALRLGNTDSIGWRNAANSANLTLSVNASNQLTFGGNVLADASGATFQDSIFSLFDDADTTKKLKFELSGVSTGTTRTLTVPDASTTIVGTDATQTLTNKTLTAPVISTISNTGTVTLPTATDTLVGRATTDTLSNKSISGSSNTLTAIPLSTAVTGQLPTANGGTGVNGSATFPTTGTVVTRTAAEALTNKDFDGGTASNTSRITVPSNTKTNLDSLTRKAATVMYATDSKKLYVDDGSTLSAVGSGSSSINYLSANSDFEAGVSGYTVSKNTSAAATPDSGFVTTGTNITFTQVSSTALAGNAYALITKGAANYQGQQVCTPFQIDNAYKGQQLSLNMIAGVMSGTYATGDLTAWIYDVTNNAFTQPSAYQIGATTIPGPLQPIVFQSAANSNSYKLCIHVATTSTSAYTVGIDNLNVGPVVVPNGTIITDWVSYTPTITNFGTVTNVSFQSRRVGDSLEVRGKWTNGTTVAATSSITLGFNGVNGTPAQDSNKIATGQLIGHGASSVSSSTQFTVDVLAVASSNAVNYSVQNSSSAATTAANGNALGSGTGANMTIFFSVPIVGWSSNSVVSDSAATRSITLRVAGSPNSTITPSSWSTLTCSSNAVIGKDDIGGMVATTGLYTVKVPGTYKWQANTELARSSGTATEGVAIRVNRNSGAFYYYGSRSNWVSGGSEAIGNSGSGQFEALAGDVIKFEVYAQGTGLTWNAGTTGTNLAIQLDQGPAQIQAATEISLRYSTSTAQTVNGGGKLTFAMKFFDPLGAWNGSKFTAPAAGRYRVHGYLQTNAASWTAGGNFRAYYFKNGGTGQPFAFEFTLPATGTYNASSAFSTTFDLIAGDTIEIATDASVACTLSGNADRNYIQIERIGGIN